MFPSVYQKLAILLLKWLLVRDHIMEEQAYQTKWDNNEIIKLTLVQKSSCMMIELSEIVNDYW